MIALNAMQHVDACLAYAQKVNASDIHIEPKADALIVRYRVDGLLQCSDHLPLEDFPALSARIKVLAGMDTSQSRLPQDGRFSVADVDVRVASLPTLYGEKFVLRLLHPVQSIPSLADLGMVDMALSRYQTLLHAQSGMILVTGPTGSGKTTTLYSSIQQRRSEYKNFITLEDPIEYRIPEINQVQINLKAGLTFPVLLRAILRQDPDIIMIGEIRDTETAHIAIRAALTGHLVLSTLHTHSAAGTLTRLLDMGIPGYLLSAALLGVVSQRLVRKLEGGRMGLFEVMRMSDEIKHHIRQDPHEKTLSVLAQQEGMILLEQQMEAGVNEGRFLPWG